MSGSPRRISQCPVCDAPLRITELSCTACETRLQGVFPPAPLARLSPEHQRFIETFVRCRGVIRDVERALGISYPTVRARLDAAVVALEAVMSAEPPSPSALAAPTMAPESGADERRRREILRRVAEGEMEPAEAAERLRRL